MSLSLTTSSVVPATARATSVQHGSSATALFKTSETASAAALKRSGFGFAYTSAAICADIAEHATRVKKEQNVAMYWALQKFASKLGITLAGAIFASLIILGRDRGDDLGLRITAVVGALILCFTALYFKQRFREEKLLEELKN